MGIERHRNTWESKQGMALAAALCGGILGVTISHAKGTIESSQLLFFRFLVACLILWFPARSELRDLKRRESLPIWLVALTGALSAYLFFDSLQKMTVGAALVISHSSLPIIVVLSWIWLDEQISLRKGIGVLVCTIGTMMLLADHASAPTLSAFVLALLGAILLACTSVCLKAASRVAAPSVIVLVYSFATMLISIVIPGR